MGYHTTINQRTAIRRAFQIQDILPPGMGTIYAWDWAYVLDDKDPGEYKKNVSLDNTSIRFSYIGLANQVSTDVRIGQHISDSQHKKERGLYVALGDALNKKSNSTFNDTSFLKKSGNGVVEIIHVASLFDVGNLESYMIQEKEKTVYPYSFNNFNSLINEAGNAARGEKIGLNTLGGKQGDPLSEGTTTSFREWIAAAYIYFIEEDREVIASRGSNDLSNSLLRDNNNSYEDAITALINQFVPGVDTKSDTYIDTLNKFGAEVQDKNFRLKESKDLDFKTTFQGSYKLQAAFTYIIGERKLKIDSQIGKKIILKQILDNVTYNMLDSDIQKILDNIKKDLDTVDRDSIIREGLSAGQSLAEKAIRKKGAASITNAFQKKIVNLIKQEAVISLKSKKDLVTGMVYGKIEDLLKNKYPHIFAENTTIFSSNALGYEKTTINKFGGFLNADSVAKIILILETYIEVYYSVLGSAPTTKELLQALGEATKDAFGDTRILQQITKKSSKKK